MYVSDNRTYHNESVVNIFKLGFMMPWKTLRGALNSEYSNDKT